ncbi:MAG: hypothetical protein ABSG15_14020 [FCB group bacterium]|jgi:hypothetical protein
MFKNLFIILGIFVLSYSILFSQLLPGNISPDVVNGNPDTTLHDNFIYLALAGKVPQMVNRWGVEVGISAGFTMKNSFNIGGGYYYLITHNMYINNTSFSAPEHLRLEYGGVELGYNLKLNNFLTLTSQSFIGIGKINLSQSVDADVFIDQNGNWLFVLEPGEHLNINVTRKFIVDLGINYRIVLGVDYFGATDKNLSGPVFSLGLKFLSF